MSTALYRRYRPETFADVIGQEHVTGPLMQALRTGRVNHAYLFSGPRGCGKTTSARILARCLNCEQGPTDKPCGVCESCVALARGGAGTVDVIEIDAASHGGVDDARDLRERASYGPAQSRFKVYIIDEAHMVTPQGFNALLKIVEEPPEHVKFVFATTEPEKVIGTIRSRTHHYPFRLVPPPTLTAYMEDLCAREQVAVAPGVLSFVVRAGGGSVRDSLSVLDQLIAGSGEAGLTYESAAALLGFTDTELLDAAVDALAAADGAAAFKVVDRVVETGSDPRRFVEDLLERLRDLIVLAAVPDGAAAVLRALPEDQLERMRAQTVAFGAGSLSRAADVVNAGLTEMTGATSPRLQLELIIARVLLPGAAGERGYAARLDRLERRLDVGGVPPAGAAMPVAAPAPAPVAAPASAPVAASAPAPVAAEVPATHSPSGAADSGPSSAAGAAASGPSTAGPAAPSPAPQPGASAPAVAPPSPAAATVPQGPPQNQPQNQPQNPAPNPPGQAASEPVTHSTFKGPGGIDTAALRRAWPDVLANIFGARRITWTFLSEHAQVLDYNGDRVLLGIATSGLTQTFQRGQHAEYVRQALIDAIGLDTRVEAMALDGQTTAGPADVSISFVPPSGERPSAPRPTAPPTAAAAGPPPGRAADPGPTPGPFHGDPPPADDEPPPPPEASWSESPRPGTTPPSWGSAPAGTPPEWAVAQAGGQAAAPSPTTISPSSSHPEAGGGVPEPGRSTAASADPGGEAAASATDDGLSAYERARRAVADEPVTSADQWVVDDSAVSDDDEDIEGATDVGIPVVERVLGATVIREEGP